MSKYVMEEAKTPFAIKGVLQMATCKDYYSYMYDDYYSRDAFFIPRAEKFRALYNNGNANVRKLLDEGF